MKSEIPRLVVFVIFYTHKIHLSMELKGGGGFTESSSSLQPTTPSIPHKKLLRGGGIPLEQILGLHDRLEARGRITQNCLPPYLVEEHLLSSEEHQLDTTLCSFT